VPVGPAGHLPAAAMWEHRLELERALETAVCELGGVDVAHLRFADAGAFAAARVFKRLGVPVAFTAAPDPHAVIDGAQQRGELTRDTFPAAELSEHYLLRAGLVADLLAQAQAVVVLPRPDARAALQRLIGVPLAQIQDARVHTIAEGISFAEIDRAAREPAWSNRDHGLPSVADDLLDRIAALPPERHGLPLLVSVGRLHRVKGLPLLLEAWAGDDDLHRLLNLVIVGGGLEQPTPEETIVLGQLDDVCARAPRAREGFVLLGHRANRDVATMLHIARAGLGSLVAPHGIYACTSQKEEFGVALLEAMATGLAVVAPDAGGPATYVHEGLTGCLADTASVADVREALRRAAAARADETRAQRASGLVRSRYTIEAMATSLAGVYRRVVREPAQVAA
jgi:glycosyltransferase involved in cell wall biosynthesis